MSTDLGMPVVAPAGVGHLRGDRSFPDAARAALADTQLRRILDTRADVCTAADSSCLMHIGGGLQHARAGVRVMHLAEILASEAS